MSDILAELGLTKEQMVKIISDKAVERLLEGRHSGEEGEEYWGESDFKRLMDGNITKAIDVNIQALAKKHVLPGVAKMVKEASLQETNKWGEKKGEKITFIEYLVLKAEHYMHEEVDYEGRTKGQKGNCYSWTKEGTRVAHMVHEHLRWSIEKAMKQALDNANSTIVGGLEKAVKIKLDEIAKSLKVRVSTKNV